MTVPGNDVLISIDPGVNGLGYAVHVCGQLVDARYLTGLGGMAHPLLERLPGLEAHLRASELSASMGVSSVVEIPQVYDSAHQKGDQHDLIRLAIVVGTLLPTLGEIGPVLLTDPKGWKGQAKKEVTERRARALLSEEEINAMTLPKATSLHHNVWDAVGIGQWRLGRLKLEGRF